MKPKMPGKHLLVIDDEENMRHMLSTVLGKGGYVVETAANGHEGLKMAERTAYDFILCDIKMPNMSGMDFLKASRNKLGCTTVIMMSAYGTIDTAIEAMKLGAYDYISKPFKTDEVYLTLKKAEERESLGLIRHWNLRRAITVEADLDPEVIDTLSANNQLRAEWDLIRARFPSTDLDFSGELDDLNESLDAMGPLFLLGAGLIYLILAAQFRSYFQPLLILVTVPLAFTGVTLGLLVSGNPLSLYTLYGVIALTGIAVNAAIVLIDAANARLAAGMNTLHATLYAARRRVIAILMTTATTIAGLFSLAFGLAGQSLLWGPVAASIVWGLAFSTVLTLFVVPVLYRFFMQGDKVAVLHPY